MKKVLVVILIGMLVDGPALLAVDPQSLRMQAASDIQTGSQLMTQAEQLLRSPGVTQQHMKAAMDLYIQAGKLFEEAGNIFTGLGPDYAAPEDVQNSRKAMQNCIDSVKEIQKHLR